MTDNTAMLRQAGVDLGGLMTVLSKHLYSTPIVALRELVQNAHDSIVRRRIEQPDWQDKARIDIIADTDKNQLRIIDTGAGLTEEEIHKYLATVGVGYTRGLRQSNTTADKVDDTGLIGMFGLGFLSAFVLAKRVSVYTTSYQSPQLGCLYVSTDAQHYTISHIPARAVGTEIVLELQEEYQRLIYGKRLQEVLAHYCALLVEPIYINHADIAINPEPPPWRCEQTLQQHPAQARKQALAFATRFEKHFEPICTLPVKASETSDAVGLLWIQDGATYGTSDNRNLSVFLRGMLLDDDARDLLPNWAGFIGGVIESQQLTPTASREDLQRDAHFEATRYALSEALIQGLAELAQQQPEAWRRVLRRHNEALLGAALCDERLQILLMDNLHVPTSQGDLLVNQLLSRGAVHVVLDNTAGFEDMLFRALGIPVAQGNRYAVVPFLRRWTQAKGVRLIELGTKKGNQQLFQTRGLDEQRLAWLETHLCHDEKLIAASFAPDILPLIVVPDREQALKKRLAEDDKDKKISQSALRLARQFTAQISEDYPAKLYLNLDNIAIQQLLDTLQTNPEQAVAATRLLKAFKTVLILPSNPEQTSGRLQEALTDLATSLQQLLPANDAHKKGDKEPKSDEGEISNNNDEPEQ